ncbi:hypothetical protein NP233_g12945 [Leucocoprinus birnbaumii]|uniref:Uncharacterized protein n=1 Tax=Leucocoprinus birnbaumii TaxID=56174 RepID=A0AAD5VEV1_9AGAR|nr:hypothetical protein NP233_g12945 [Leucocoprinus birnbaumii]
MPWSAGVIEQWEIVDLHTTDESDFYGPFTGHLSSHLAVPRLGALLGRAPFLVRRRRIPVLFVEIKAYRALEQLSAREEADGQMRGRFREFVVAGDTVALPVLYGLSAFGPRFCVYSYTQATRVIEPVAVPRDAESVSDVAPKERWECSLLDAVGEARFREVVDGIKAMVAASGC